MKELITQFLFIFTSIFTIVNPFGAMPFYLSLTENLSRTKSVYVARRASVSAFIAMMIFALGGKFIFDFFGISVDNLRVVGGILFFITGYDMLQGKVSRTKALSDDEIEEIDAISVTPMAIPTICGPGAITVVMVLANETSTTLDKAMLTVAALLACVICFFILVSAKRITRLMGPSGNKVFSRLMGLVLMMIALKFFFAGLKPFVSGLVTG